VAKRNMFGGPERHKACGECDGQPDKRFRKRWRNFRRARRAPAATEWTDEEWNAMHAGCGDWFLRGEGRRG